MTESRDASSPRARASRLALGATVQKVALLSVAATLVLLAGLWLQMASGHDPALTEGAAAALGDQRAGGALAAPAQPAPVSSPMLPTAPAPVQTTSS